MQGSAKARILVIHGPNLNMLGKREPEIYGATTLEEINTGLEKKGGRRGGRRRNLPVEPRRRKSWKKIQKTFETGIDGVVINPAAFTHTSVAVRDALLLLDCPIIEIHLSNIYKREPFRHKSMVADIATAQISGLGVVGYELALEAMIRLVSR